MGFIHSYLTVYEKIQHLYSLYISLFGVVLMYCRKQIDVNFYASVCPLIDDKLCHNIVKVNHASGFTNTLTMMQYLRQMHKKLIAIC